jgi:UDP-glucose 4-epimerase
MNNAPPQVVALTGACTALGRLVIQRLDDDPEIREILVLDVREPPHSSPKVRFHRVDLTSHSAGTEISAALAASSVDTVIHGAFLSHATPAADWAHELEDVGTMHLLDACARARPFRLVLLSTTLVYGPAAQNPNYLAESAPLEGIAGCAYIADKVAADLQVQDFARLHPDMVVTTLRLAPVLGPKSDNVFTRFFARPASPSIAGFDPLIQVLHEEDAAEAVLRAVQASPGGPINIAAPGVLPYSSALAYLGRIRVPLPYGFAKALGKALWSTQIIDTPPEMVALLKDLCVADTSRMIEALGLRPRYNIAQTLDTFLGLAPSSDDFGEEVQP